MAVRPVRTGIRICERVSETRTLKPLGIEARRRLIALMGKPVHLNLWVKVDRNWSKRPKRARELGYL